MTVQADPAAFARAVDTSRSKPSLRTPTIATLMVLCRSGVGGEIAGRAAAAGSAIEVVLRYKTLAKRNSSSRWFPTMKWMSATLLKP